MLLFTNDAHVTSPPLHNPTRPNGRPVSADYKPGSARVPHGRTSPQGFSRRHGESFS